MTQKETMQQLLFESQTGGQFFIFDPAGGRDMEEPSYETMKLLLHAGRCYHDLLEALKLNVADHVMTHDNGVEEECWCERCNRAKEAIAKAEGEK